MATSSIVSSIRLDLSSGQPVSILSIMHWYNNSRGQG